VVDGLQMASQYEYKDHTADIQIHSWGDSVEVPYNINPKP